MTTEDALVIGKTIPGSLGRSVVLSASPRLATPRRSMLLRFSKESSGTRRRSRS